VMIDAIGDCVLAFAGAPVPTWDKIAYATLSAVAIGHRVLKVVGVAETPTK
jgi:class 3 adenylate cyclase